ENIYSIEMFTTENDSLHQLILDTPPRTMANFLIMRVVQRAFELIDLGPRQSCIAFVIDKMGQAALRIFVRNFFKKENIKLGKELVESIIKAYLKMFENSSWLVQKTKDSAISKIKKMNYIVGYPDEFEAPGALDQLYDELVDVSPSDSFYLVNRKIMGFNFKRNMDDSARRIIFSATTLLAYNAFYYHNSNAFG
uniref:Peptidase_M13_N domain-containing protein n=2 Tax=Caenorhabditis japonica TaxID=281687 RepID=A0A8R1EIN2_CAEJA